MAEQQDVIPWPTAKDPGIDAKGFTANGHEYQVATSISIARYEEYELLGVEAGLARNFEQVFGHEDLVPRPHERPTRHVAAPRAPHHALERDALKQRMAALHEERSNPDAWL